MDIDGAKIYIKCGIEILSKDVAENINKQETEYIFDTVKGFLIAALCRLGEFKEGE